MCLFPRAPFCLDTRRAALKPGQEEDLRARQLARYLIEDNRIEIVKFDPQKKDDVHMINSIFKNVLENYQLKTIEQEEELHNIIKHVHPATPHH